MSDLADVKSGEVRVKFGPREHQTIPVPVADAILSMLRERQPVMFGELLSVALIGPEAVKRRRVNGHERT